MALTRVRAVRTLRNLTQPPNKTLVSRYINPSSTLILTRALLCFPFFTCTNKTFVSIYLYIQMAEVEYRCFVGGLAWATNDESLEQAFSQFGDITDSKVRLVAVIGSDRIRFTQPDVISI